MEREDSSSPLVVEKSEVVLVKPSKQTPEVSLSLSTIDNNPAFESIVQTVCVFAPKPYLKDQVNHDPSSLLQYALSRALVYYYPLAGKLHRRSNDNRLELNCKAGDGVPFVKATAACTLSSLNYLENAGDEVYNLVPCYDIGKGCEGYDPLALQITKFACGGITIGMAHAHSICDGVGVAQFFRAMIELASGKREPTITPVWNRDLLTYTSLKEQLGGDNKNPKLMVELPKATSSITTSPYNLTDDMVQEIVNITSEDITKLKKIIADEVQITDTKDVVVTTLETIAAQVWRARCQALELNEDGTTVLGTIVGIRGIMEPPLPEGYYGNAFVNAFTSLTARELSEAHLSRVVQLIKEMKRAAQGKEYVLGKLNDIETRLKDMASFEGYNVGFMMLSDWRQIGLQYDGWGGLVNIIPLVPVTFPSLCVLLPASNAVSGTSGGVRLLITLPRDAMAKFKEEMKAF